MEEVIIPVLICSILFIGLPWIIFHYITKWKTAATLTKEDENLLDELHDVARRLDERMCTIERILQAEIGVLDDALRASEADIAKLEGKLREARTRQNAIMTRMETAENRVKMREMYAGSKVDEAFSRFDVLERRADYAEGRADALALGGPPKSLDEEIAELRNAEKVEAELAALKAKRAGSADGQEG